MDHQDKSLPDDPEQFDQKLTQQRKQIGDLKTEIVTLTSKIDHQTTYINQLKTFKEIKDVIVVYESGKKRRYELFFAVNGGAFAITKIFHDPDKPNFLGSLTITELAIGMTLFTIIMALDIFFFGWGIRKYGFGIRKLGIFVIVLLAILLSLGWLLAGFENINDLLDYPESMLERIFGTD